MPSSSSSLNLAPESLSSLLCCIFYTGLYKICRLFSMIKMRRAFTSFSYFVILITCVIYYYQEDGDSTLQHANNLLVDSQQSDLSCVELDALRGRYIRRLTAVIIHHIPALWKVALSVSSGKFAKVNVPFFNFTFAKLMLYICQISFRTWSKMDSYFLFGPQFNVS